MPDNTSDRFRFADRYDTPSVAVAVVGVSLGFLGLLYVSTHPEPDPVWAFEFVMVGAPAAALIYGGRLIARQHFSREERWSVLRWCLLGGLAAGGLVTGYVIAERTLGVTVADSQLLVLLGTMSGAVVGTLAAISSHRSHLAVERTDLEADRLVAAGVEPLSPAAQELVTLATDARSWYVIRALRLAERPLTVESIAAQIAALEGTTEREVYVDLQHVRLPKLVERGLVSHDSETSVVELGSHIEELERAGPELAEIGETVASAEES